MFDLWPLFLLRDEAKRKEMTGTQHEGTFKLQFLHYITIEMVLVLFLLFIIELEPKVKSSRYTRIYLSVFLFFIILFIKQNN
jgi:hypothetical protein